MITSEQLHSLAINFEEVSMEPHFHKDSYRIRKKIFVTYDKKTQKACLKLSKIDQSVFCAMDKLNVYPVPNKWGQQGWTFVELSNVNIDLLTDALRAAYCEVAPSSLADKYSDDKG